MLTNNSESHPNSRKVTIFRAHNFMQKQQNNTGVEPYLANTSAAIGPYWEKSSANVIGTGLSPVEIKILMPEMLSIDVSDRDFNKLVKEFFLNLNVKVPYSSGLDLEIGLSKNNDLPLSSKEGDENLPLNISDYIRFRFIKKHPWVAASKEEADGNQLKHFWILDRDAENKKEEERLALADEAREIYFKIKDDESRVKMILTLDGRDEREYLSRNGKTNMLKALNDLIDTRVADFLKIYKKDHFETRYWLKAMQVAGVISEIGTSYVIASNKKLLGKSIDEAILYLEDEQNSDTILYLKQAAKEALQKPKVRKPIGA